MGLRLKQLKVPITFCQLDGIIVDKMAHFIMEPVEMRMGKHRETLNFIVTWGLERPLLLLNCYG